MSSANLFYNESAYLPSNYAEEFDDLFCQRSDEDELFRYKEFALEEDEDRQYPDQSAAEIPVSLGKRAFEELTAPQPTKLQGFDFVLAKSASESPSELIAGLEFEGSENYSDRCPSEQKSAGPQAEAAPQGLSRPKAAILPQMKVSQTEKSDKTDLKMFSELTINLLKRNGQAGLPKEKIEAYFRAELTQKALANMSDNYCLRRRLNLILTVLKCPEVGLIQECRDPSNRKLKVIKLTQKYLNDETCKMINDAAQQQEAVVSKKSQLLVAQSKLNYLQHFITQNKAKSLQSVQVARLNSQGVLTFEHVPDSTASRISLLATTVSAQGTQIVQTNTEIKIVSCQVPTQICTLADKLFGF